MSLHDQLFQLKFASKQLQRQSTRSTKDINKEKAKLKKAIEQGNHDGARIYAENAIRLKNQSTNYLRMSSRIDAVAARVDGAIRMNQVSRSMGNIVKGMDRAMQAMDMQKITMIMDKFEQQFEDLDVQSQYVEKAMNQTTTLSTPQEQVDGLIQQVAEANGLQLQEQMGGAAMRPAAEQAQPEAEEQQDELTARLARLKDF